MTKDEWGLFPGRVLAGYRLRRLVRIDQERALFRATHEDGEFFVWLEPTEEAIRRGAANFGEIAELDHPNLMRVFESGDARFDSVNFRYLVTEAAPFALRDVKWTDPPDLDDVRDMAGQIAGALSYLHANSLVYGALRAETVWRAGDCWKLGDFSALRAAGVYDPHITRQLLIRSDWNTPPEAFQGRIMPAWDLWSLGAMLNGLFGPVNDDWNEQVQSMLDPAPEQRQMPVWNKPSPVRVAPVPRVAPAPNVPPPERKAPLVSVPLASMPLTGAPPRAPRPAPRKVPALAVAVVAGCMAGFIFMAAFLRHPPAVISAPKSEAAPATATAALPEPQPAPPLPPATAAPPSAGVGVAAKPEPAPIEPPPSAESTRPITPETREIEAVLDRWLASARTRNVSQQMTCYAPVVDRFFNRQRLTLDQIRRERQRQFALLRRTRSFAIDNVEFRRVTPEWAVVAFHKNWAFQSSRYPAPTGNEMILRPVRGEWKISSERETSAR